MRHDLKNIIFDQNSWVKNSIVLIDNERCWQLNVINAFPSSSLRKPLTSMGWATSFLLYDHRDDMRCKTLLFSRHFSFLSYSLRKPNPVLLYIFPIYSVNLPPISILLDDSLDTLKNPRNVSHFAYIRIVLLWLVYSF